MQHPRFLAAFMLAITCSCLHAQIDVNRLPPSLSGIYPSLAYTNHEGECGTGAVVPWADRLWIVTYGPHQPFGSSDKLYEITPSLERIIRPESVGGTPANRFIHRPSGQLFIGHYLIDSLCHVVAFASDTLPGRLTGACQSLSDPANRFMVATMEQGFYSIDARSHAVATLFKDGNQLHREGAKSFQRTLCKGVHGKGFYSGQGVYVYSNNGEDVPQAMYDPNIPSGSLSEYDGNTWQLVRRNQFTEVTGPGGIYGNPQPDDGPIWSLGWDNKSVILAVRAKDRGWEFFRLPKASHAYDGAHGWNTEWPRIRSVADDPSSPLLMTMHGMFWQFPNRFTATDNAGIRPVSSYLKVIGDFANWHGRLVFGCDDTARNEFLNKRSQKGNLPSPAQSCSNLWFTTPDHLPLLGPTTADGAVWQDEDIAADTPSEPFLIGGWDKQLVWISNDGAADVTFRLEGDVAGNGQWSPMTSITLPAHTAKLLPLKHCAAEWIRVVSNRNTHATVAFTLTGNARHRTYDKALFRGIAAAGDASALDASLYSLGNDSRRLAVVASVKQDDGQVERQYYELDTALQLLPADTASLHDKGGERLLATLNHPTDKATSPLWSDWKGAALDQGSILITDDKGRRWRLPIADDALAELSMQHELRLCREIVTERDLFHCAGTFFELPAENADGFAKIRPVASHHYRIHDFASFAGMLVMSGIDTKTADNPHILRSPDGKAALWAGVIDDLWQLGKPVGHGALWLNKAVEQGEQSDPFLTQCYDRKTLTLSHKSQQPVTFTLEADPSGNGIWMTCADIMVKPGQKKKYKFPDNFQARWIRLRAQAKTEATATIDMK